MKYRQPFPSFVTSLALAIGLMPSPMAMSAQQALWELGTLTCSLASETQRTPSEPGQGREALCQFRVGDRGAEETYVGTLQIIGQDTVPSGRQTIMLIVKAPISKTTASGLLQQTYSAVAPVMVGKQAPLVGENDGSIVLQLASAQSDWPSMALGQSKRTTIMVVELRLKSSPA
jgi:hypothetical protein